jgi:DNA-binding NtrC family response regulator
MQKTRAKNMARILIIDDDSRLRQFLSKVLIEYGDFEVLEAGNGSEGISMLNTEAIDLVVTDIFMPEEDGIGTIMEISKKYPEVKIIAMSGGGNIVEVDYLKLASNLGAQKVFQKPFDTGILLSTIQKMLD